MFFSMDHEAKLLLVSLQPIESDDQETNGKSIVFIAADFINACHC